jgi:hypothetical protein
MENMQQVAERVKEANNILVTVSTNPSVDQLSACIALTLALNKLGKHATAVFSGHVPSTIEFLQPEMTLEKNTDSLRDFIISLDKSKADKLRYKVEDKVVKIFITPYKTSISDKDLEFSQGDFNVDVVLALGVHNQVDLDQAITSHGRILHDATVVTINNKPGGDLGSINWLDAASSSLSELAVQLVNTIDKSLVDSQIATAMLTGIVAETDRFSNGKTSPRTMTLAAELMTAGANQQLVATKLEQDVPPAVPASSIAEATHDHEAPIEPAQKTNDGTLEISHEDADTDTAAPAPKEPEPEEPPHSSSAEPEQPVEHHDQKPAEEHEPSTEPKQHERVIEPIHVETPQPAPAFESVPAPQVSEPEQPSLPQTPPASPPPAVDLPAPAYEPGPAEPQWSPPPQIHIDEHGSLSPLDTLPPPTTELPSISHHSDAPKMVLDPPLLGGQLTANTSPDAYDAATPFGMPGSEQPQGTPHPDELPLTSPADTQGAADAAAPFLLGDAPAPMPPAAPQAAAAPEPASSPSPDPATGETLADIERSVHSSHVAEQAQAVAPAPESPAAAPQPAPAFDPTAFTTPSASEPSQPLAPEPAATAAAEAATSLQDARNAVSQAMDEVHAQAPETQTAQTQPAEPTPPPTPVADPGLQPAWSPVPPPPAAQPTVIPNALATPIPGYEQPVEDPNAPPPVPPPMMPPAQPY